MRRKKGTHRSTPSLQPPDIVLCRQGSSQRLSLQQRPLHLVAYAGAPVVHGRGGHGNGRRHARHPYLDRLLLLPLGGVWPDGPRVTQELLERVDLIQERALPRLPAQPRRESELAVANPPAADQRKGFVTPQPNESERKGRREGEGEGEVLPSDGASDVESHLDRMRCWGLKGGGVSLL